MNSKQLINIERVLFKLADDISGQAIQNDDSLYWLTQSTTADKKITYIKETSLYGGNAGIALLFLELYNRYSLPKFLETADKSIKWIRQENKTQNRSSNFLSGKLGFTYLLLRYFKICDSQKALQEAEEVAKSIDYSSIIKNASINEYLNGISGMIVALTQLHSVSKKEWILSTIHMLLEKVLASIRIYKSSICYDISNLNTKGLTGFSHGASGVGYMFCELAHYFNNEHLLRLAKLSYAYEEYFYSTEYNNYADFRKGYYNIEEYNEILTQFYNNKSHFNQTSYMNAWCHGIAGIGMARLKYHKRWPDDKYYQTFLNSLRAIEETDISDLNKKRNYTICHGVCGNAANLIDAYETTKNKKYIDQAIRVGNKVVEIYESKTLFKSGFPMAGNLEDMSLFNGNAGIAYFLLRLLDPTKTPSILYPSVESIQKAPTSITTSGTLKITSEMIKGRLFKIKNPRTAQYLLKIGQPYLHAIDPEFNIYLNKIEGQGISSYQLELISALKDLDSQIQIFDEEIDSRIYLFLQKQLSNIETEELELKNEMALKNRILIKNPLVKIIESKLKMDNINLNHEITNDLNYYLLIPQTQRPIVKHISLMTYLTIQSFQKSASISEAFALFEQRAFFDNSVTQNKLYNHFTKQVSEISKIPILINPLYV